jgi:hypothetical protein
MPRIRDEKRYKLPELAREIEEARNNHAGQPVSFEAFRIENVQSVLESGIDFHPEIPDADRRNLIWKAILNAATNGVVDSSSLMSHLTQAEDNYLRSPLQDYVLATSLTINYFPQLTRLKVDDTIITFSRRLPTHFKRQAIQDSLDHVTVIERPDRLTSVRIRVKARTDAAAVNQALDHLDFFRGIWNYGINWRTRMRYLGGLHEPEPINHILLGPVHTLHSPDGSLLTESFWYQSQYLQYGEVYDLGAHWTDTRKWHRIVHQKLKRISYKKDLRNMLIHYTRALDNIDHEVAFNKLWAVLEHLTNSPGKYEDLIKRTLFLTNNNERDYVRLILEHLREVRNGSVHDDKVRDTMMTYLYQLKWFIERLLNFHLYHGPTFHSIADAGTFLALPVDMGLLKERISDYRKALRFQTR